MYSFKNDYTDGGHPDVLKRLTETAHIQETGYGEDQFCMKARDLLRTKIGHEDADIHFLSGGTITNLIAISAFLRPHEAVISAKEGHIYVHETGAIEATGHKVLPIDTPDGKVSAEKIKEVIAEHHFEHMVKPKLVYISQSTEMGTLYSLSELMELRRCCDEHGLYLYMDGARLGSALCSRMNDLDIRDITALCDAFYIGGTKNGALFGEALVIGNDTLKTDFRYHLKQRGGLLAKGRLLGVQFLALFEHDLFFDLAKQANSMAERMQKEILASGFSMKFTSGTNQIFPILPEPVVAELEEKYQFYRWEQAGNGMITIRLICAWNTEEAAVNRFIADVNAAKAGMDRS